MDGCIKTTKGNTADKMGKTDKLKHVGGINDELGGVDPFIDDNLMRLSGGP